MSLRTHVKMEARVYRHAGYVVTLVIRQGSHVDVYVREDTPNSKAPAYHVRYGHRTRAAWMVEHAIEHFVAWKISNEIASMRDDDTETLGENTPTVHTRLMAPDEF